MPHLTERFVEKYRKFEEFILEGTENLEKSFLATSYKNIY